MDTRWKKYKIEQLKVPKITREVEKQIETLYQDYKESNDTIILEKIDLLIYKLFNLTEDEIRLIEQA